MKLIRLTQVEPFARKSYPLPEPGEVTSGVIIRAVLLDPAEIRTIRPSIKLVAGSYGPAETLDAPGANHATGTRIELKSIARGDNEPEPVFVAESMRDVVSKLRAAGVEIEHSAEEYSVAFSDIEIEPHPTPKPPKDKSKGKDNGKDSKDKPSKPARGKPADEKPEAHDPPPIAQENAAATQSADDVADAVALAGRDPDAPGFREQEAEAQALERTNTGPATAAEAALHNGTHPGSVHDGHPMHADRDFTREAAAAASLN